MSIFSNCQSSEVRINGTSRFINPEVIKDVAYGKDSLQKMDVYLPANRSVTSTKSLILIHGGSWNSGSKKDFNAYVDSFKRRQAAFAIFNLDYRLLNAGHKFPAQENDVKLAVDYIVSHAKEYGINDTKLVLLGASAGGHLALLQTYKYQTPKVAAVIDFFGPTDLIDMYRNPWNDMLPFALQMITGYTPSTNEELYFQSSPVNFITPSSAPTLILHGGSDRVVNVNQSKTLALKLDKAGVAHELIVYPNERHGWWGSALTKSFDKIDQFLEKTVK